MKSIPVSQLLKEKKIFHIINPRLVQTSPETSLKQAVCLMQENRSGYVVIVKNQKPVGIFTEVDVVRKILGKKADWKRPVSDWMTPDPVVLSPEDSVGKAIDLMAERRFYHIPLVDRKGNLTGMLSVRSLIRFLAEFYPTEVYNLPPCPHQVHETREGG
ncbi:MAG: CBS domain-containing protein [Candidatus Omnitrophica bacterium]|nr:CBS domain-containing protein [Candidatus Omnitrophota bacterium]